jgi:hypothetical protein
MPHPSRLRQERKQMQNEKINWFHGRVCRGGWQYANELHLAPHPFDDERLAHQSVDSVFQFVRTSRIEVDRTRLSFGNAESWEGEMVSADPLDHTIEARAKVKVCDRQFQATAQVDAVIADDEGPIDEYQETLIVVPQQRLHIATPRRIGRTLEELSALNRRRLLDRVSRERRELEPRNLAFSIGEVYDESEFLWFRMTLIRAMIRWMAERDRAGCGPRYHTSVRRPAA